MHILTNFQINCEIHKVVRVSSFFHYLLCNDCVFEGYDLCIGHGFIQWKMAQPLELWWSPHRPSYYPRQCYIAGNSMKDGPTLGTLMISA